MKTFLLSIIAGVMLYVFGTCFILGAQSILGLYKAQSIMPKQAQSCTVNGNTLTCKY